uniref:Putative secreted protein n=1 Tax=Amblyomma triste TaxID=251400 RepID=A0A023G3Z4_AMBTT
MGSLTFQLLWSVLWCQHNAARWTRLTKVFVQSSLSYVEKVVLHFICQPLEMNLHAWLLLSCQLLLLQHIVCLRLVTRRNVVFCLALVKLSGMVGVGCVK